MKTATGFVALVQEGRFRLADERGWSMPFILGHDAPLEPQDLVELQRRGARVRLSYEETPNLVAGIVRDLGEETGR